MFFATLRVTSQIEKMFFVDLFGPSWIKVFSATLHVTSQIKKVFFAVLKPVSLGADQRLRAFQFQPRTGQVG